MLGIFFPVVLFATAQANCPGFEVLETGGISCELKNEIVKKHNELRNAVASGSIDGQPPAANMRELYWDDELAEGAQKWANHCTFAHNPEQERQTERFKKVGQNIGITRSKAKKAPTKKDFAKQIKKWFDENSVFNFNPINPTDVQTSGHYTQLAWANTHLVGCGYSRYRSEDTNYRLYVCHYAAGGNTFKGLPYIEGEIDCPDDLTPSTTYPALCASENSSELCCDEEEVEDKDKGSSSSNASPKMETRKSLLDEIESPAVDKEVGEKGHAKIEHEHEFTDLEDKIYVKDMHVDSMFNIFFYRRSRD